MAADRNPTPGDLAERLREEADCYIDDSNGQNLLLTAADQLEQPSLTEGLTEILQEFSPSINSEIMEEMVNRFVWAATTGPEHPEATPEKAIETIIEPLLPALRKQFLGEVDAALRSMPGFLPDRAFFERFRNRLDTLSETDHAQ